MNILYISQYFHPEICAPSDRALANTKYLSNKGHNVTVITEIPNHPKGVTFPNYKRKFFVTEKMEKFIIHRVWVLTSEKKNFTTRILFYCSFMFFGLINSILKWKNYDVVYISSPPLFVGFIGIVLKKLFRKTKIVFEVRDLWPKSAVVLGELKNPKAIKIAEMLETKIYNISSLIVSLTKGIHDKISNLYVGKSFFLPNGVDINSYGCEKEYNIQEEKKFIVIYSGTHGLIHGLETIIDAADILRNEDIHFHFYGDGPIKTQMISKAKQLILNKVKFYDSVNPKKISEYLYFSSVGISTTKRLELCKGSIPVKIFSYMACGLPIVLSGWGEAVDIINEAQCGIVTPPEKADKMADAILWMKNHPKERIEMGKRGRKFVEKYYNREKQAEILEKELLKLVEE